MTKTFQGCSELTERKEFEIEGVTSLRFNQFKNKWFDYSWIICADVFCGTGKNEVEGEVVDGSPVRLLDGFIKSKNTKFNNKCMFWFSDIRKNACHALNNLIHAKYDLPCGLLIKNMKAADSINKLGDILYAKKNVYLYLILDPNGPKDFPKLEVEDLLSSFNKRIDVIPYISANAVNRCIQSRNKAGMQFRGWLGEIENFDQGFVKSLTSDTRKGWIRKPVRGDGFRWTMVPTFGCMPPKSDWKKQGYVDLESEEGVETVKFYCGENS